MTNDDGLNESPHSKPPKKAAAPRVRKPPKPKAPKRYKYVWSVGVPGGAATHYGWADRASADADCAKRGKGCIVLQVKVEMEADAPPPIAL